jgi:hypothetical protein
MQFGELPERDFQLALADETPGSDHVGNDVDADGLDHEGSVWRVVVCSLYSRKELDSPSHSPQPSAREYVERGSIIQ